MSADADVAVVTRFNDRINLGRIDGLAALMTDDHVFIDTADNVVSGKANVIDAWRAFFAAFPDYRNVFDAVVVRADMVVATGHSISSAPRLDGPAIWTAKVRDGRLTEWRVHHDTPEIRQRLKIGSA